MFASRSKVEELEERVEELESELEKYKCKSGPGFFPTLLHPSDWHIIMGASDVYDEGSDYKGRRSSNNLNNMGLG